MKTAFAPLMFILGITACGQRPGADLEEFSVSQLRGTSLPSKTLSLTFDDGPGPRTRELGDYLISQGIRATFFVQGSHVAGREATLARLHAQGHLIANHTFHHTSMAQTSNPVSEVKRTDGLIAPYITDKVYLFRAPYGDWSSHVTRVLNATSLRKYVGSIFWDVGGAMANGFAADWACWNQGYSVAGCGQRYLAEVHARGKGIVLIHDIHGKSIDMVKYLIPRLKAEGFQFRRLDAVPAIAERIRQAAE